MALGAFHLAQFNIVHTWVNWVKIYGNFHIKEMEMRRRVKQGKQHNNVINIVGLL